MSRRSRGGFTLVELIVVTVLGSLVLMAALQVLVTNQRTYTAQNAAIEGQQGARMALDVLFNDLREASPAGGDILYMSSDSIQVRLMRKFGIVCEVDLSLAVPLIKVLNNAGERFGYDDGIALVDTEQVFLFADNYENDEDDDVWIEATLSSADTTETCFGGTEPATELVFADATDVVALQTDSVRVGAPVRSYETYTYAPMAQFGTWYLGRQRHVGVEPMRPIAGPIRGSTGVEFTYLDALGDPTTTAADVRQIVALVRTGGRTLRGTGGGRVADSITAWIYTRN